MYLKMTNLVLKEFLFIIRKKNTLPCFFFNLFLFKRYMYIDIVC